MFINSKKHFEIREGSRRLVIPCGYIGSIPDWAAQHWLVRAAVRDGSLATPDDTADKALEAADVAAALKAEGYGIRPEEEAAADVLTEKQGRSKTAQGKA